MIDRITNDVHRVEPLVRSPKALGMMIPTGTLEVAGASALLRVNRRGIFTPRIASRRNVTGAAVLRAPMDCEPHRDLPVPA